MSAVCRGPALVFLLPDRVLGRFSDRVTLGREKFTMVCLQRDVRGKKLWIRKDNWDS